MYIYTEKKTSPQENRMLFHIDKENLMEFATKTWQGASYSRIFETC
jgi:hypothetical protein